MFVQDVAGILVHGEVLFLRSSRHSRFGTPRPELGFRLRAGFLVKGASSHVTNPLALVQEPRGGP